jgi:hypothetical protein
MELRNDYNYGAKSTVTSLPLFFFFNSNLFFKSLIFVAKHIQGHIKRLHDKSYTFAYVTTKQEDVIITELFVYLFHPHVSS